jgi:gas vesicle protein
MNRESASGLGLGILIGAITGAALGILFAPQAGRETRYLIRTKTATGVSKAKSAIGRIRGGNHEEDEEFVEEEV